MPEATEEIVDMDEVSKAEVEDIIEDDDDNTDDEIIEDDEESKDSE